MRVREFKEKSLALQTMMGSEMYEKEAENLKKDEKKLVQIIKRQEKVLFVAFHLLLNLAEDLQDEIETLPEVLEADLQGVPEEMLEALVRKSDLES